MVQYNQVAHVLVVESILESGFYLAAFVDLHCQSENVYRILYDRGVRIENFVTVG